MKNKYESFTESELRDKISDIEEQKKDIINRKQINIPKLTWFNLDRDNTKLPKWIRKCIRNLKSKSREIIDRDWGQYFAKRSWMFPYHYSSRLYWSNLEYIKII